MSMLWMAVAAAQGFSVLTLWDGYDTDFVAGGLAVDDGSRPHIAFVGDGRVHHAMLDGTWSVEHIEASDPHSYGTEPATLVARGQDLYLVWGQGTLWWAQGSWGTWDVADVGDMGNGVTYQRLAQSPQIAMAQDRTLMIVDSGPEEWLFGGWLQLLEWVGDWRYEDHLPHGSPILGTRPRVAFDSSSQPVFVWEDQTLQLRYGTLADVTQDPAQSTVFAVSAGNHALAVDAADQPVVAMRFGDEIRLLRRVGADWTTDRVDTAVNHGQTPALHVDDFGGLHLLYIDEPSGELRHATELAPQSWAIEVVDQAAGGSVALATRPDASTLHAAQFDGSTIRYGVRDAVKGTWAWEDAVTASDPGYEAVAVHYGQELWVAHFDEGGPAEPSRALVLTRSNGQRVEHDVVVSGELSLQTDLVVSDDGDLAITWVADGELVLTVHPTEADAIDIPASRAEDTPVAHGLAFDSVSGSAVVAYLTPNPAAVGHRLIVARPSGASWSYEVLAESADTVDVEVATDGVVSVAWRDADLQAVVLSTDDGSGWTTEVLDDEDASPVAGCGVALALALDVKDNPIVVYACELPQENADIFVLQRDEVRSARWTGNEWIFLEVTQGLASEIDLWVDSHHAAHAAIGGDDFGVLRVLKDDVDGSWSTTWYHPSAAHDVAIVGDDDDVLSVLWRDPTGWDLNLAEPELALDVQPLQLDFGAVPLTTSAEQDVTVTNTGTTDLTLPLPVLEGPNPEAFQVLGTCGVLVPQATCTWTVRFVPERALPRLATLRVVPGHTVALSGTGQGVFDTSGCTDCGGGCRAGGPQWTLPTALHRRR